MSGRPSFTVTNKSTVTINIPPDWFSTVQAISRKPYYHLMMISPSIPGPKGRFLSTLGTANEAMKDMTSKTATFPVMQHDEPIALTLEFYYSEDKSVKPTALRKADNACSKVQVLEESKAPNSAKEIPDYYTYFIFVEDTPDDKQVEGSGQYDDLVATVYLLKTNPNEIPPPPPPDTNPGYNDVIDRPRPSKIDNYLKYYDTAFLIDDSGSMQEDNKWTELNNALIGISNKAIDYDADGIDLFFLNSNNKFSFRDEIKGVQDRPKVAQAMQKVSPNGGTPTGLRVKERMREFLQTLDSAVGTPRYSAIKPLDLICITDGVPTDDAANELGKVLVEISAEYRAKKHHPNWMGIQFVQIGNDAGAKEALEKLTELDTGSMVDTVPYTGPGSISPDKMERILLGGLHPNVRAQRP